MLNQIFWTRSFENQTDFFQAGIGSHDNPTHVLIALEPEAASIYCRKLKRNQIVPERPKPFFLQHPNKNPDTISTCSDFVLEDSIDGELLSGIRTHNIS